MNRFETSEARGPGRLRTSIQATCGAMLALIAWGAAPLPVWAAEGTAPANLYAERITAENFAARAPAGPDADAGIGDWALGNGTICAAISDPAHESPLSPKGGLLIDLSHCGTDDDQWAVFQPLLNLSQRELVPVDSVEAGRGIERAWIRTRALFRGVAIETTYQVDRANPTALSVSFRAKRVAKGERLFGLGAITLHASGQLAAFSLARDDLSRSGGFVHPANDRSSTRKLLASLVDSNLTILVGGPGWKPISYGVERTAASLTQDGVTEPVSTVTTTGGHYTLHNALASPPWLGRASGRPGLSQLAQLPFMDLELGATLGVDYRIWVGERADVASVTDRIFEREPIATGRVDDPAARIEIQLASGAPISEVVPDDRGRFGLRLPPGPYRAIARAPAGREVRVDFEVPARSEAPARTDSVARDPGDSPIASTSGDPRPTTIEIPALELGQTGRVSIAPGFIGRLVFLAEDGSGPIRFGDSLRDFRVGDEAVPGGLEAPFLNVATTSSAARSFPVPPGRYRVLATRGPEYETRELAVAVAPGREATLELAPLARRAPTPGWLAADFHVHTGQSFDSSLPEALQIEAFAASGAEVLVSTEHDRIFDPRPAIAAAGLDRELVGITGSEMTSAFEGGDAPYTSGHLNAFPLTASPKAFRRGAVRLEGRRLRDVLAELRASAAPPFVQINHPRPSPAYASDDTFFHTLGVAGEAYDPTRPARDWPNSVLFERGAVHGTRDLDVEGVELMNAESLVRYRRIRADWLSFLLQGVRIVGTANSDSHSLGHVVGLPRTYVRVEHDRVDAFDEGDFMQALRDGRAWGTTGPLLHVRLGEAEIGQRHTGSKAVLEIRVDGADWIPVAEWRAYVDGELVHRAPIARGQSARLPLVFSRDAFVTVEVEGPAEGLYRELLPEFVPFAFSNPIFVDADGDGRWDAPGLPERDALPSSLRDPDRPD